MNSPITAAETAYDLQHSKDSAVTSLVVCLVISYMMAATAVAMRLLARRLKRLKLAMDDYMAIVAMVSISHD